ncbi:MAG: DUF2231 domain-containing protein [Kastovskya adunca ATA6-11-RM4]|jgi:uncharacterized membrane protein|nr:DUF2231 domain-containing protein [Kastovskya adunca ATA6-11-RM4]
METPETERQEQGGNTAYANIPVVAEGEKDDYRDSGITSTVAIAGHPIHPALVTLPIAFLVAAPASDIGYWLTSEPFWARASFYLIAAGLASGVLAALTGMLDLIRIKRVRERKAGWAHAGLNILALGLTILNLLLRWGEQETVTFPAGLMISVVVALLLSVSAWYGAELIYRHKIAVIGYSSRSQS